MNIYYDEASYWPEVFEHADGKVKAKRWWWPPDRIKAKLLTVLLNSESFKKTRKEFNLSAKNGFFELTKGVNKCDTIKK